MATRVSEKKGMSVLLSDYNKCQVCLTTLNKPKILRCLHVFCADCIWSKSRAVSVGYEIICPICDTTVVYTKESLPSVDFLKTLQAVVPLQGVRGEKRVCEFCSDDSMAVFVCQECQVNLCGPCLAIHDKVKGAENHRSYKFIDSNLQDICRRRNDTHCDRHPDEIVTYHCVTCAQLVCVVCDLTEHQHHVKHSLLEEATAAREELYNLGTVLKSFHKLASSDSTGMAGVFTTEKRDADMENIEKKVLLTADGLHKMIDSLTVELRSQIKTQIRTEFDNLSEAQSELKKRLEQMKSSVNFPVQLSNYGSDTDVIKIIPFVRDAVKKFQENQQFVTDKKAWQYFPKVVVKGNDIVSIGEIIRDLSNGMQRENTDVNIQHTAPKFIAERTLSNIHTEKTIQTKTPEHGSKEKIHAPSTLKDEEKLISRRSLLQPEPINLIDPFAKPEGSLPEASIVDEVGDFNHTSGAASALNKGNVRILRSFSVPWDTTKVAVDANNNYVIANRLDKILHVYTSHGKLIRKLESFDGKPYSLAVMRNGNYIFTDKDSKGVSICTSSGVKLTSLPENSVKDPGGVCLDRRENIVVCDTRANDVILFINRLHFSVLKSCSIENCKKIVKTPIDVACSKDGNIVVVDIDDHCVKILDENLVLKTTFGSYGDGNLGLKSPRGACVDEQNRVIVADYYNDRLIMITMLGEYVQTLVNRGHGILGPRSVAIDNDGHIVLAQENGQLKVIEY